MKYKNPSPDMARPRKDPATTKSAQVSLRLPAALRDRLDAARQEADPEHSLNQEIEIRLRLSFDSEQNEKLRKQFGETNFWLFKVASRRIRDLEKGTTKRWWEDAYTFKQVKLLVDTMLDHFKPGGRALPPKRFRGMSPELGEQMAIAELASIEIAMQQSHLLDGLPGNPDGTLRRNLDGTYMGFSPGTALLPGTVTSLWPHAGEWFVAAGALVPKMKKLALTAFLRQLEAKP